MTLLLMTCSVCSATTDLTKDNFGWDYCACIDANYCPTCSPTNTCACEQDGSCECANCAPGNYDETFTCEECNLVLDWDLYVHFKLDDDLDCDAHRCISCHNDMVFTRIINFIDEMK